MVKVTLAGLRSTQAMIDQGCPSLTPELLASVGARYSRNDEGLNSILAKIENMEPDAAVDTIFKHIDYGHQSIADMVPVAMFIDRVSLYLVMEMWRLCPTASGQESSTRYIRFGGDSTVLDRPHLFPDASDVGECSANTQRLFAAYEAALRIWEQVRLLDPSRLRIPEELLKSDDLKDIKQRERIARNYAFDRARYYIPLAAYTNVMMIMSARNWVQLIQLLYAMRIPEAGELAGALVEQLQLVAPRMARHARLVPEIRDAMRLEFQETMSRANIALEELVRFGGDAGGVTSGYREAEAFLDVYGPPALLPPNGNSNMVIALKHHKNRYQPFGTSLRRLTVRFGWDAIPIAEIRDLNRHRTGHKHFPVVPVGCYVANDEIESLPNSGELGECKRKLLALAPLASQTVEKVLGKLAEGTLSSVYLLPLGAQCAYEHTTQANFFAYQVELRTGVGTHYYYAQRMRDVLKLWHELYPGTRDLLVAGTSEPE